MLSNRRREDKIPRNGITDLWHECKLKYDSMVYYVVTAVELYI